MADAESAGPYVHGKLVSEELASGLAAEPGLEFRIIRAGAIVDGDAYDPPGRLGRRIGNWFVAVGRPREEMGVVDLEFAAATLAWMALEVDAAPPLLNLIAPPTRRALVERPRRDNPTVKVVWVPRAVIVPALNAAGLLNRLIRSGARLQAGEIFGHREWDTSRVAAQQSSGCRHFGLRACDPTGRTRGPCIASLLGPSRVTGRYAPRAATNLDNMSSENGTIHPATGRSAGRPASGVVERTGPGILVLDLWSGQGVDTGIDPTKELLR